MKWASEAIDKLRQYEAKKQALQSIPEEIKSLEAAACGIRSATSDGTPVAGGGSRREDMLLSNIVLRKELKLAFDQAGDWVKRVEEGLAVLTSEERLVLDRFFIHPEKNAANRLAGDLHLDVKTVYRRKDAAVRKFTTALYGCLES
jgi:hypothetical protein